MQKQARAQTAYQTVTDSICLHPEFLHQDESIKLDEKC